MGVNSPLPARLQEETRKAAKIMRSFVDSHNNGLDKVIPQSVLQKAAGFAIFTVFKAGFLFSARAGSGVVIARTSDGSWSPPSAIGLGGFGFGGQLGAEQVPSLSINAQTDLCRVTDFLIVLNSPAAVKSFMSAGSLTLGGNLSIAVGPLGRNAEGSGAVNSKGKVAAMYSYSKTKGLFGGVSVEGSIIVERQDANRLAYGGNPTVKQILSGTFDPPEWAQELIDGIERCTGLPGGQKWQSWDEEGEGGAMGFSGLDSPKGERGGYVFGDGVGGHGGPTAKSEAKEGRRRGASVGVFDQVTRPSLAGKRNSSFNPFSSGSSSPKRAAAVAGMASSENYNAGLTWDSDGPMTAYGNRSRSGSSALRPAIDLEGRARSYSDPKARRPQRRKDEDLLSSEDDGLRGAAGDDLHGTWGAGATDDKFSSSFAKLKMDGNGTRSRSNSKPPVMASLDEGEYAPYETESKFAARYAKNGMNSPLRFDQDNDPFGGESSSSGRAFESYHPSPIPNTASPSRSAAYAGTNRGTGTPPQPSLKRGLSSGPTAAEMGYARAIALFDLPAGQAGDLALKKGGVLFVMDKVGAGEWWRGMNTAGEAGIFPANYIEVVEIPKELKGGLSKGELKRRVPDLDFE